MVDVNWEIGMMVRLGECRFPETVGRRAKEAGLMFGEKSAMGKSLRAQDQGRL